MLLLLIIHIPYNNPINYFSAQRTNSIIKPRNNTHTLTKTIRTKEKFIKNFILFNCKSKIKMSNEVTNFFLDLPRDKINIFSRMDGWMYVCITLIF